MTDLDDYESRAAIQQAMRLHTEIKAFEKCWPSQPAPAAEDLIPAVTWTQLERQLTDLTDTDTKAIMVRDLVSATRKMARFKPPEMVLREVLCLAGVLLDESFRPGEEGDDMT